MDDYESLNIISNDSSIYNKLEYKKDFNFLEKNINLSFNPKKFSTEIFNFMEKPIYKLNDNIFENVIDENKNPKISKLYNKDTKNNYHEIPQNNLKENINYNKKNLIKQTSKLKNNDSLLKSPIPLKIMNNRPFFFVIKEVEKSKNCKYFYFNFILVLGMKRKNKKSKILFDDKKENEINSSNIQTQCSIKQTKNKNVNKISLIKSQSIINSDVSLYFLS